MLLLLSPQEVPVQPSHNLLLLVCIPPGARYQGKWTEHPPVLDNMLVVVRQMESEPVFSPDRPFPDQVGSLLRTERGVQHRLPEELAKAKGLGVPPLCRGWTREVADANSAHLCTAVCNDVADWLPQGSVSTSAMDPPSRNPNGAKPSSIDPPAWA